MTWISQNFNDRGNEDRLNNAIGEIERLRAEMRLDLAIQEMVELAELLRLLEVAACRCFAALRDAITTKDQIKSALSDRIPTADRETYIRPSMAHAADRFR